jgi:hypothetical protein
MLTIEQGANIAGGISSSDHLAAQQPFSSDRKRDARAGNVASSFRSLDFSALDLPSPIAAGA